MGKFIYLTIILFIVITCQKIPTDTIEPSYAPIIDTLISNWRELVITTGPQQDGWYEIWRGMQGGLIDFPQGLYKSITVSMDINTGWSRGRYAVDINYNNDYNEDGLTSPGIRYEDVINFYRIERIKKTFKFDSLYHNVQPYWIIGDEPVCPDSINHFLCMVWAESIPMDSGEAIAFVKDLVITAECK